MKTAPADIIAGNSRCGRGPRDCPYHTPPRCSRPRAADEVDFDIANPPLKPATMPGKASIGLVETSLSVNDVLLGRGQNTSCRAGNRLFRSLVASFRPIYLTLRRREKPKLARTIMLIVRQRGGRFLRRAGEDGRDDNGGEFLYEVGDERAEKKTSQALREGLAVRATTSALQGCVGRRGKFVGGDRMAVERQELPDEVVAIVSGGGEDTTRTSKRANPHTTRYAAVSPTVSQSPSLLHNIPHLRDENATAPQAFESGNRKLSVVDHPSNLSCYPFYDGMTQRHYYSYGDCYGPTHCHNRPPPSHIRDGNLPHAYPQFPPILFGGTVLSSSVTPSTMLFRRLLQSYLQQRYIHES